MSENLYRPNYSREKKITLTFDGITEEFTLVAPSAKDKEAALSEAQLIHAETVKRLTAATDMIKAVYLLHDKDLLIDALLEAAGEQIRHKAALTLVKDAPDYEARLNDKVAILKETQRLDLVSLTKEQLTDRLVIHEIDRQINYAWEWTVLNAMLARTLHGNDGGQLFLSVDRMKEGLPPEVLNSLCERLIKFLSERGNAQVFP